MKRKAWWNVEKEKYKNHIKKKEESMQIHINEMDKLRNENRRLVNKLNLACVTQQRELLKAFVEYMEDNIDYLPEPDKLIDSFIESLL